MTEHDAWVFVAGLIVGFVLRSLFLRPSRASQGQTVVAARPIPALSGQPLPGLNDVPLEVLQYLRENRKINAIKVYREIYGVGLREAKDAVEEIERQMR